MSTRSKAAISGAASAAVNHPGEQALVGYRIAERLETFVGTAAPCHGGKT